jgi:hypothetical protein
MLALVLVAALSQAPEVVVTSSPEQEVAAGRFLDVRHLQAGEATPAEGVWMDLQSALIVARAARACELEREALKKAPPAWVPWVAAAAGLVAGGFAAVKGPQFGRWVAERFGGAP